MQRGEGRGKLLDFENDLELWGNVRKAKCRKIRENDSFLGIPFRLIDKIVFR